MAVNEAIPYWDTGDVLTCHAQTAVTGKRLVSITGERVDGNPRVGLTGAAAGKVFGVAAYDAAAGAKVTVHHAKSIIVPVTASGAVAAGALLEAAANGMVRTLAAGVCVGCALSAAADGQDVPVDRSITS